MESTGRNPYATTGLATTKSSHLPSQFTLRMLLGITGTLYTLWGFTNFITFTWVSTDSLFAGFFRSVWILGPGIAGIALAAFLRHLRGRRWVVMTWAVASAWPLFAVGWTTSKFAYSNGFLTFANMRPGVDENSVTFWVVYFALLAILLFSTFVTSLATHDLTRAHAGG